MYTYIYIYYSTVRARTVWADLPKRWCSWIVLLPAQTQRSCRGSSVVGRASTHSWCIGPQFIDLFFGLKTLTHTHTHELVDVLKGWVPGNESLLFVLNFGNKGTEVRWKHHWGPARTDNHLPWVPKWWVGWVELVIPLQQINIASPLFVDHDGKILGLRIYCHWLDFLNPPAFFQLYIYTVPISYIPIDISPSMNLRKVICHYIPMMA